MCADTHLELENPPEQILHVMCGDNSSGFVGTPEASIGGYRINLGVRMDVRRNHKLTVP